jgi:2-polyprenyl-3-methyl-5-hydroxy-6-metoxy-1,4-benzoquinol methylase
MSRMVVDWSKRTCLLCRRQFNGRTFLCRECSERYRSLDISADLYRQFYEALDREYPARSNTYGAYNEPAGLLRAIERLPRQVRVLEIGAGGGHLGSRLVGMGFTNITLSDFTDTTLAAIRERLPQARAVSADASSLPFADASFEVVISTDVIEHLPDVDLHLREVARVLTERGLYMVKTPNRLIADAYYRVRDMHDSYFWHPSMFTPGELTKAFDLHGFDTHFVPANRLTGAQVAKVPGPAVLKATARSIPLGWLPLILQPHLEAVARKRSN